MPPALLSSNREQQSNSSVVKPVKLTAIQQWVFEQLNQAGQRMKTGQLTMGMPNGQKVIYGTTDLGLRAELNIQNPEFFDRVLMNGHVGFGESFVAGDWISPNVADVIAWFVLNYEHSPVLEGAKAKRILFNCLGLLDKISHWFRHNSVENSSVNIAKHYDLSNEFFKLFLDESMAYSSGVFDSDDNTLEQIQQNKFKRLVQLLRLQPNDHILEIGSGWGGLAIYMAKTIGCKVTTITISKAQFVEAQQRIRAAGVEHLVDLRLEDYRHVEGQYDKIVSVEMIEAVGEQYLDEYLRVCTQRLKHDGLLVFQMIACPDSRYELLKRDVDFIQKHIFPGSLLPSLGRVQQGLTKAGSLGLVELDDIGLDYAKTLRMWLNRFNAQLPEVQQLGFDDEFIRKWQYYLQYCEAAFATRNITDLQVVFSRPNNINLIQPYSL